LRLHWIHAQLDPFDGAAADGGQIEPQQFKNDLPSSDGAGSRNVRS